MTVKTISIPQPKALPAVSPRLAKLEAVIETGHKVFLEVGKALMEINKDRLYRERGFKTFEEYCKRKWSISRPHAYRQIKAAKVIQNLSPQGDNLPMSERQARELVGLSPSEQRAVAAKVSFDTATPAQVREVVQAIRPAKSPLALDDDVLLDDVEADIIDRILDLADQVREIWEHLYEGDRKSLLERRLDVSNEITWRLTPGCTRDLSRWFSEAKRGASAASSGGAA